MKKILILGASSYIGKHLFAKLGPELAVGTYKSNFIKGGLYFDALTMDITDIIDNPTIFSHAVIMLSKINPDYCFKNIEKSTYLNVVRTSVIIDQLKRLGIIPVFISTEVVFDGKKGNYVETDPVNPILVYGQQKIKIERYLQDTCDKFIIVRLTKVFGSCDGDGTLLTTWLEQLERNVTIKCARDQVSSPIYVNDVAKALIRLVQNDCAGVFHLSNKKAYSRLDMLKILIENYCRYKKNEIRVQECSIHDFPLSEKRPLNTSLKPDKLVDAIGFEFSTIESICEDIAKRRFSKA